MDTYSPIVQNALSKMDEAQQLAFRSEYSVQKKNLAPMVIATIFFLHFFFYGRVGLGVIYVLVCFCTIIGLVWWLIELCMVKKRVREYNGDLALNIARDMKIMT